MMAAHGISVLAQEMIIRWWKDRFIVAIVPNIPPETRRRPPVASATGLPDICQISPALLLWKSLFHILKNAAAAPCSSTIQQQGPQHFITPILAGIL